MTKWNPLKKLFGKAITRKKTLPLIENLKTLNFKKKLYGPFSWMGFNCLKAIEPLRGGSLLFTIQFPEIPGTHFIDLGRMKG